MVSKTGVAEPGLAEDDIAAAIADEPGSAMDRLRA
jgi:hypothetical protein